MSCAMPSPLSNSVPFFGSAGPAGGYRRRQPKTGGGVFSTQGCDFSAAMSSMSPRFKMGNSSRESEPSSPKEEESPLLKLVSLQNADGSWPHGSALARILGLSESVISDKALANVDPNIWATVLAILWLHLTAAEQKDEWELLEGKAVHWLQVNAGAKLAECVKAGNAVLGSSVSPQVFGL
ncbi:von Willebrand factor A domain-containing protein 5A-like [Candoia aspera]|uniref:von Willebrand factor A domain-containing protein 5A-like n=1 Tax=Candoia aspera TaxID=51853 RepID=UPI002FD7B511